MMIEVM